MRPLLLAVTLIAGLSALTLAHEQSLGELSRATEASRNTSPGTPAAKAYSNKDLPDISHLPPAPASTNSTAPTPNEPAKPPSSPSTVQPPAINDEAFWRDRMRPLRERLDHAVAVADDTKRRAEALMRSADRCFRVGVVCEDYNESLRATEELKRLTAEVEYAKREVTALEEEARRAGVPPGWLRD